MTDSDHAGSTKADSKTVLAAAVSFFLIALSLASCSDQRTPTAESQGSSATSQRSGKKDDFSPLLIGPDKMSTSETLNRYMPGTQDTKFTWQEYLEGANKALKLRDYDSAEYLLNEAIKLAPNNGQLYCLRGRARYNSVNSDYDLALADLQKAKELKALAAGGYSYIAGIYDTRKEPDKAIATLTEGLTLYPESKELHHSRAVIYVSLGQKLKAKQDYDKTIELDPKDALPYLLRAQLLESMGRFEEALKDYTQAAKWAKAREKVQKRNLAYKGRAMLLGKLGRHKEALAVLDEMSNVEGSDDETIRFRADQFMALKMYDKAIAEYSKSIDMAPDFSSAAYESRAKAYAAIGKADLAAADRAKAQSLRDAPAEQTLYKHNR
ncbi:MAG TPA: tetratricopeptide repeat protein [Candidatus Obscuribacterales bacterium]